MAYSRFFSGIQPTGSIHLGNLLGTVSDWVKRQDEQENFFSIVDLHAITLPKEPSELRQSILTTARTLLALGLDMARSTIFIQSDIPAHAEAGWLLQTLTTIPELSRMTQYKEKSKNESAVPTGLLTYPTLMAADILLYSHIKSVESIGVPVGEDQKQHLELARDLADRFNRRFGQTFRLPEAIVPEKAARVMDLVEPEEKMSKSASEKGVIYLADSPETIGQKIKAAKTDSTSMIAYDRDKRPAISNLLEIYHRLTERPIKEIENQYQSKGYLALKDDLSTIVVDHLLPIQKRFETINEVEIELALRHSERRARMIAERTLADMKLKMGLGV